MMNPLATLCLYHKLPSTDSSTFQPRLQEYRRMASYIDHQLDKFDQALTFKSSVGKTSGISESRTRLSAVWKDMTDLGDGEGSVAEIISLSEKEEELVPFFDVLGVYCGSTKEFPKELKMSDLISLLALAEKF